MTKVGHLEYRFSYDTETEELQMPIPDILPLLLSLQPALSKTNCRQLSHIVLAIFAMTGRVTQLGIARWAEKGASYRTVQRFFQTDIDWLAVNWLFFQLFHLMKEDVLLLIGDESVVSKAGKITYGLGRFYSSIFEKPIPGLAFFNLALVSTNKKKAYPLVSHQVIRTEEEIEQGKKRKEQKKAKKKEPSEKKPAGRPKGSKNKNKAEIVLSPELKRILGWGQTVMTLLNKKIKVVYFVLDGHFGNHFAREMTRQLGLHIISKMRSDAALFFEPTAQEKEASPNLKYGKRVNYACLPASCRVSIEEKNGIQTEIYQLRCWHKDFPELLNVVIIVKTNIALGRVAHVVLFSSDLNLEALKLIEYYSLRFQIEFTFRDAKQYFGLEDFMCITKTAVDNAANLSLFMVNVSSYLLHYLRKDYPDAGIQDLKSYYRGRCYASEILKCLPEFAESIFRENILKRIPLLGLIHASSKPCKSAETPLEFGLSGEVSTFVTSL